MQDASFWEIRDDHRPIELNIPDVFQVHTRYQNPEDLMPWTPYNQSRPIPDALQCVMPQDTPHEPPNPRFNTRKRGNLESLTPPDQRTSDPRSAAAL